MRGTRAATLLAATALALTACGSSGTGRPGGAASAPPSVNAEDINPQPLSNLKQGGTLTMSIQQWITQYNPYEVDGENGDGQSMVQMVEPTLFLLDASGTPHINTDYLLSAQVTSTSPQVVTYRLNPKARWSDGKQLSWLDFQAMWKALNGTDSAYIAGDTSGYSQISGVAEGAGPQEVRVTFAQPYADWQRLFKVLMPAAAFATPKEFNDGWLNRIPITAGPFHYTDYNATTQTVTAEPDPQWWGQKPKLAKIIYRALGSTAATDAYLSGEIDFASASTTSAYAQLKNAPNTVIRTGARWDEVHITMNGADGPLKDVRVRQALEEAIDRRIVARSAGKGMPFDPPILDNHFFMPNQKGYQDNSGVYGTYDPAAARKLLDAAGWKDNGSGKPRTRDGQPLTLSFVLSEGASPTTFDMAAIVQQMLAEVGMQVKVEKVPDNDYNDKYVNKGAFDLTSFRNVDEVFPSMLYPVFQQTTAGDVYQNYGRVGSPEIDQLMTQAARTTDPAQAAALYNQADKLIWQQGHSLELYQRPQLLAVRKGLANFGASGLADWDYTKIGWMK
jgi:peptide/nickel transport system substrate-binding protein